MPAVEATVITPPRPRSIIAGTNARVRMTTASQLTRTISAWRSAGSSAKRPRRPKPALLTRRSTSAPMDETCPGSWSASAAEIAGDDVGLHRQLVGQLLEAVRAPGDQDQLVAALRELSRKVLPDAR